MPMSTESWGPLSGMLHNQYYRTLTICLVNTLHPVACEARYGASERQWSRHRLRTSCRQVSFQSDEATATAGRLNAVAYVLHQTVGAFEADQPLDRLATILGMENDFTEAKQA